MKVFAIEIAVESIEQQQELAVQLETQCIQTVEYEPCVRGAARVVRVQAFDHTQPLSVELLELLVG